MCLLRYTDQAQHASPTPPHTLALCPIPLDTQELHQFTHEHAHTARCCPGQLAVVLLSGDEDFLEPLQAALQVAGVHVGFGSWECWGGGVGGSRWGPRAHCEARIGIASWLCVCSCCRCQLTRAHLVPLQGGFDVQLVTHDTASGALLAQVRDTV